MLIEEVRHGEGGEIVFWWLSVVRYCEEGEFMSGPFILCSLLYIEQGEKPQDLTRGTAEVY